MHCPKQCFDHSTNQVINPHISSYQLPNCVYPPLTTQQQQQSLLAPPQHNTTAATVTAMQQQHHDQALFLRHKALPILLSHDSISGSQQLLATLMITSRALSEAISEQLVGSVSMRFQIDDRDSLRCVPGLADFISKRGHILRACDICLAYDCDTSHLVERALALGFKEAAQSPRGLHLQSYEHHGGTSSVLHVLNQLPPQHLQHLHLCVDDDAIDMTAAVPGLVNLTGLTSLTLRSVSVEQLVPALSALCCLHALQLSTLGDVKLLALLPSSIVSLHLAVQADSEDEDSEDNDGNDDEDDSQQLGRCSRGPRVQLAHLTQCTALTGSAVLPLPLRSARDALPPHLQCLHVELHSNAATEPLRALTALTSLTLLEPQVDSREHLEALAGGLTNLKQLQVDYSANVYVDCTYHSWGGLPINSLHMKLPGEGVDYLLVPAAAISNLPNLAGTLTELCLAGSTPDGTCTVEATPRRLAGVLQQLTGLETLCLKYLEFEDIIEDDDEPHDEHMNQGTLMKAVAGLPRLSCLSISLGHDYLSTSRHPVTDLSEAKGLTRLELPNYALEDFSLIALTCELTGLEHLDLTGNPITNAPLPAIAAQLCLLTCLQLAKTHVTETGLPYLTKLQKLQCLNLPRTVSGGNARNALGWSGVVVVDDDGTVELATH